MHIHLCVHGKEGDEGVEQCQLQGLSTFYENNMTSEKYRIVTDNGVQLHALELPTERSRHDEAKVLGNATTQDLRAVNAPLASASVMCRSLSCNCALKHVQIMYP